MEEKTSENISQEGKSEKKVDLIDSTPLGAVTEPSNDEISDPKDVISGISGESAKTIDPKEGLDNSEKTTELAGENGLVEESKRENAEGGAFFEQFEESIDWNILLLGMIFCFLLVTAFF
ncbi:MAG: hypothetical protein HQM08_08435 [Candidatus Riflebacteria bacterium]|nr:hypothetical protein [Candidatus Riflebacteria bacterium]